MENRFVITGAPGSGKTAVLHSLRLRGFNCIDETAREIISAQLKVGGTILPWVDVNTFNAQVLAKRIHHHSSAPQKICFFDRGIPDAIGYSLASNKQIPNEFYSAAKNYRYNKIVFFTEPWEEIYKQDSERKESFSVAIKVSDCIKKAYSDLDYKVTSLPFVSIEERVDFILNKVGVAKK